jgi:hypothetical protein
VTGQICSALWTEDHTAPRSLPSVQMILLASRSWFIRTSPRLLKLSVIINHLKHSKGKVKQLNAKTRWYTAPRDTWWRWLVRFTSLPLYSQRNSPRYPVSTRMDVP